MGEENQEAVVAEQPQVESHESHDEPEEKQVPLKALQAERKKRQEAEYQSRWLQEQLQTSQQTQSQSASDDGDELMTKADYSRMTQNQLAQLKRQTLEEAFLSDHPDVVDLVETELPEILKKKPWLAHAIDNSTNRYKTAYEVIQDYKPKTENVRKRLAENQEKPGNASSVSKGGEISKDFSKMSNEEFKQYRQSIRGKR